MKLELVLSMIALLLTFSSITFGIIYTLRHVKNTSILASNAALIQVEKFLCDAPTALRFHGIEPEDLKNAGITEKEFVYLLTSCTGGAVYYRTSFLKVNDKPFEEGTYRYIMCLQPSTRRAWPLIRKMTADHVFRRKMDKTIELIGKMSQTNDSA
jgi:hypothetical protein